MKSALKKVDLNRIVIDPAVQRAEGFDERRIVKMAGAFDILAFGTITVSERHDGTLICLDGMHRVTAARRAGWAFTVPAVVISGLTKPKEAELFNLLNATKTPSQITKFLVGVVAEDPRRVEINKIVEAAGWKVSQSNDDGRISAVTALERIYNDAHGTLPSAEYPALLERTIDIVTRAWEWDRKSADGMILGGVAMLLGRFGEVVDDRKLVEEMSDTRPNVLLGKAKALKEGIGGTVPSAVARTLVGMHNKRRRTNLLPDWVWTR